MGKKVAPGTGLTPRQEQLLELAVQEDYIVENFYLSGGTALASWYLHHRESVDLDFFSDHSFDYDLVRRWFAQNRQALEIDSVQIDEDYGFMSAHIWYLDRSVLYVDFNNYVAKRIKSSISWRGLAIDSFYDIIVNKIDTLATRPRGRDYVDFYFGSRKKHFPMAKLIADAETKFHEKIDPVILAKNFLKVTEYKDLPKMLVPFNELSMQRFYEDLARSLKPEIFTS